MWHKRYRFGLRVGTENAIGRRVRDRIWSIIGILCLALPAAAQVQIGDNLQMNMNGNLSSGYTASYGDTGISSHGFNIGGNGLLRGSYYNPQFLSFSVQPYYGRSQSNSAYQSISDSSGLSSSVSIFAGSHFPGYVAFNRSLDTTGQFGIPGFETLTTHGDSQGYSFGWGAYVPDLPTLSATYSSDSTSSSIFGSDATTDTTFHNLSLRSDYTFEGFRLNGAYLHQTSKASFPTILSGEAQGLKSEGSSNSYQISATHKFPMQGNFGIGASRMTYGYEASNGSPSSGTSDSVTANLGMRPLPKMSLSLSSNYNDNLIGILPQELQLAGGGQRSSQTFRSLLVGADGFYQVLPTLAVHANVSHQDQFFLGQGIGNTQVNASANYIFSRKLLGSLTFSGGVVDTANKEGNSSLGFYGTANLSRKVDGWEIQAAFSYSQNVQTLLAAYTTSSYSYLGGVSHKLADHLYWSGSFSGARSGFVQIQGSGNHSEQVTSSLAYRKYTLVGHWSTSTGVAVLTPTGLVPVPGTLPPSVLGLQGVNVFDSKGWGVSLAATPLRFLTITGSYSNANGNSLNPVVKTSNETQMFTTLLRYRFRKLYFDAGYTRFRQGISTLDVRNPGALGTPPSMVSSYYFGISRWFDLF